jgi:transposase
MLEFPHCNANTFQIYLDEFALMNPTELKMIVLDNGAFHKAKSLKCPENIILIFLPPYSPELNPAEKIWAKMKRTFTNQLFKSIEDLQKFIDNQVKSITTNEVKSICSFRYIFLNKFWSNY